MAEKDSSVLNNRSFSATDQFRDRHIGPDREATRAMLQALEESDLDTFISRVVPAGIRSRHSMDLPPPASEYSALQELHGIASRNKPLRSFIGTGFSDCVTPAVIQRNILENPGWYTQYTPYQAEIAQGRLEALLNFQTMVADLTALPVANASLLDEATAAAEAMTLCHAVKSDRNVFLVSNTCHPQTISVVSTRATAVGIEVVVSAVEDFQIDSRVSGVLVQYPDTFGACCDFAPLAEKVHAQGALLVVSTDLLALTILRPPGEFGADVAVGSAQRFGVPLGYGGPNAAFMAVRDAYKRQIPGRIVGVSKDARGKPAFRLALQTREQHIRREKATSNICTAQALLAIISSMYACYHGPHGLAGIALRIHSQARRVASALSEAGLKIAPEVFFDTFTVTVPGGRAAAMAENAVQNGMNLRRISVSTIGIALDETTTEEELAALLRVFQIDPARLQKPDGNAAGTNPYAAPFRRTSPYLSHPVFNRYHSETEMMRYIKRLESRDLSLTTSMIPLGSCTMKLNSAAEMLPITWAGFSRLHPFAPAEQALGYRKLFDDLEQWLAEITGFHAVSLQPNAGSQGEYTGLLVIRKHHAKRGQSQRNICLIPTSAHGTNPASAVMAGFKVVPVACDKDGNIDVADLRAKAASHRENLGVLMVTYPSTHGVFEESIKEICRVVHEAGGQVYMDGANMNAQVGLCSPGEIGADVCHLNLHKTFCIPHGGGGPGMGPIAVARHLSGFLPGHPLDPESGAVSAAPWGSASILPISWMYIRMMGAEGLTDATKMAILNANYIAKRLDSYFPVLYRGKQGFVAHECILDLRQYKSVTAEDVAKRLMDFSFHAPTISFPVAGTMMVEPTESESKTELDRFCDAMIAIHGEIQAIESGKADRLNNPLKNAPHTVDMAVSSTWDRPYSREQACFPAPWLREHKFWPACARIDNVFGDRNLVCTCVGMEAFANEGK